MSDVENSTEPYAVADFCLVPIGTQDASVAKYIAACVPVLEQCGLTYKMHGYGTNLEGPWTAVSNAIRDCHIAVHALGAPRIATDVRIGTRVDRDPRVGQMNEHKVKRVQELLAEAGQSINLTEKN
ncbi:hypothetical protein BKA62DRAFT_142116 [Auriculariales sp. MPI-PUGE-AT-0066]|nr:hypothetical protein BKA62DRAFT_142116 [Auriculariales sp. MPI-PUGE-AT-0066]